jgi:hypothetical protein
MGVRKSRLHYIVGYESAWGDECEILENSSILSIHSPCTPGQSPVKNKSESNGDKRERAY